MCCNTLFACSLIYRFAEIFIRGNTPGMIEAILYSFTKDETPLRAVIATTAFAMGLDIQDIR